MTVSAPKLRPLGIGQLLDQAIRLYRRNFIKFIGIIAVVQIPLSLVSLLFSWLTLKGSFAQLNTPAYRPNGYPAGLCGLFSSDYLIGMAGSLFVTVLTFLLIYGVAGGALSRAVADEYLGERTGLVEAYRKIGRSWSTLVGALFVAILVGIGLSIWAMIPCVGWFSGLGLLLFYFAVIIPLIAPTVVLEGEYGRHAPRRAWDLVRRRFWWVCGFTIVLFLFNQLVVAGPAALLGVVIEFVGDSAFQVNELTTPIMIKTALQSLLSLLFGLLYLPLHLTAMNLLYLDLRVRTEGLDLAVQAKGSQEGINVVDLLEQSPGPASDQLVTWNEFGYFVLLSIGCGAVYFLLMGILVALGMAAMVGMRGGFPG